MKKPLITIAITVFNGAEFISRAIESSLNQTYSNLEILILDDASNDNTKAVVDQFCAKNTRIVYIRNNKNIGYARSLQKLAELARGEYVQLLGADDWLSQNYIEATVDKFDAYPTAACVATEMIFLRETGGNHFDFIDSFLPKRRLITSKNYIENVYKTASILPTLTAYALFRKSDFFGSIKFMNDAFANLLVKIPIELRELHLKGFATETLFLLGAIHNYDYFVLTDKAAYIKIEYTIKEKKPYDSKSLDWMSAGRILRWFYFTRIAYEYLFRADYKKYFWKFHIYFCSELFVSITIVFMKKKLKKAFFDDLRLEDLKAYFDDYSSFEIGIAFLSLPILFLVRLFSFFGRILRGRNKKNTLTWSNFFLDTRGFFKAK